METTANIRAIHLLVLKFVNEELHKSVVQHLYVIVVGPKVCELPSTHESAQDLTKTETPAVDVIIF
jgi:hypothetical protein